MDGMTITIMTPYDFWHNIFLYRSLWWWDWGLVYQWRGSWSIGYELSGKEDFGMEV